MKELQLVTLAGRSYYKLNQSDALRPFFMSIVSDGNHWMFISSNGGITAGRRNAEYALFPYYTDDKVTESAETTGSKTIIRMGSQDEPHLWEPFSIRDADRYDTTRNLYKSVHGNSIIFEEENHDLRLVFRYEWTSSNTYGLVRKSTLINRGSATAELELVDGIQNILPYGVPSDLQARTSNLVDAYKRNELHADSGLGIYALSAIIVDKAEPSEALKANVAWSVGLPGARHLLSSLQLRDFRRGEALRPEHDVKGERGAYFLYEDISLPAGEEKSWTIVANVNQDHTAVARLIQELGSPEQLNADLQKDIEHGDRKLLQLAAAADGLQLSADQRRDTRHYANVLFNIMRGGIFDDSYNIDRKDFSTYLRHANHEVAEANAQLLDELPETFTRSHLAKAVEERDSADLRRLATEYLPLKFSRRHGDPSRPWNRFSINTTSEVDGSKILDYEGNWRDIFQNWEALVHSYPDFIVGMIFKFLNNSTFDGYNPYRITKGGFDWETIEADDPWSYIGYWGDHQIIYLLKFLEFAERYQPGVLASYYDQPIFVYANVPYKIKHYEAITRHPKDTVDFDAKLDERIRERRDKLGADGALLTDRSGNILRVTFMEKILATLLAKLSNFILEGGIWMNTQRPEWNDANNALVGNGVSMVTLYYLRRFLAFFREQFAAGVGEREFMISAELVTYFDRIADTFAHHRSLLADSVSDADRKQVLDALGQAASDFRWSVYEHDFSGERGCITTGKLQKLVDLALDYCDHSIAANRRDDGLYHAYNLMQYEKDGVSISYLDEMLEGQVAVLSAHYLDPDQALSVMDALKNSRLFREDQYSYILYPNKDLPGFLEKNTVPAAAVANSKLLERLVAADDRSIVVKDVNGAYHFNGNFKNAGDLEDALDKLAEGPYADQVARERVSLLQLFESVFNHKEFTGRSGTFYGYEGLGSIYWHMVSKLQLAVQECCFQAIEAGASAEVVGRMLEHYYEIAEGTGVHKSPELYGAFPTDPYSHTPAGRGAQQPGMTGQVKEDILSRFGELGVYAEEGKLHFTPDLLRRTEFLREGAEFEYFDPGHRQRNLHLESGSLAFTCCQVPVVYTVGATNEITVKLSDGSVATFSGNSLDEATSAAVFARNGSIDFIGVTVAEESLK